MNDEQVTALAKKLFAEFRPGLNWDTAITAHADWKLIVKLTIANADKVPREDLARVVYEAHQEAGVSPSQRAWDDNNKYWENFITFVLTEYLLTPKGEPK